jgi:hypothetical protein
MSNAWKNNDQSTYYVIVHPKLGVLYKDEEGSEHWEASKDASVLDAAHLDKADVKQYLKVPKSLPGVNDTTALDLMVYKVVAKTTATEANDEFAEAEIADAKAKLSPRERRLLNIEE